MLAAQTTKLSLDEERLYCARVRLSHLAHWRNSVSEEVEFSRFEFCISLGAAEAHAAQWRMQTISVLLSEHVRRKFFLTFLFYCVIRH